MSKIPATFALDLALDAFVAAAVGPYQTVRFCGRGQTGSRVWEIIDQAGTRAFVKVHRQRRKFTQELDAYRRWAVALSPATPRLVAHSVAQQALVLSAVPGRPVSAAGLGRADEPALYRRAGALLRGLHDLPYGDDDPMPLALAFLRRASAWLARCQGLVPTEVLRWAEACSHEAARLIAQERYRRVPCHRDYTPRNWLDDGKQLYLIDFEHARADLWLNDVERLYGEVLASRPRLAAAFWLGYGRTPSESEQALLKRLGVLAALATIAWAARHGNEALKQQGWRALTRFRFG